MPIAIDGRTNSDYPACVVRDLNWQRIRRWRDLIAEQFDSSICEEPLKNVLKVELISEGQIVSAASILLAGWISDKLLWRIQTALSDTMGTFCVKLFNEFGSQVEIEFRRAESNEANAGNLRKVVFFVKDPIGNSHRISVERDFVGEVAELQTRQLSCEEGSSVVCEFSACKASFYINCWMK